MKLLAEGTLNLSEKDKQYAMRFDQMRKEVQAMNAAFESRIDTRLQTYESG